MKLITTLLTLALLFTSFGAAYATQNFSVDPSGAVLSLIEGTTGEGSFTITNTGDENISLTLTASNLVRAADSISVSLNQSTVTELKASESRSISYSFETDAKAGNYTGSILITNQDNSTQKLNFTLTAAITAQSDISLTLVNADEMLVEGDLDERTTDRFRFENTGNITLTNLKFEIVNDLEGIDTGDEIRESKISFDPDEFDELDPGRSRSVEIKVNIPDDVEIDTYEGIFRVRSDQGNFEWTFLVEVTGGDLQIEFDQNKYDVRNGLLTIIGEEGEYVDDNYEFEIQNTGNIEVRDLHFEFEDDLEGESSSDTISKAAFSFSPSSLDLGGDDDDVVEIKVSIPDDQKTGSYYGKLRVLDSTDEELDSLRVEVKVVGDVYIEKITFDDNIEPDSNLEVNVTVHNQGSKIFRDVSVSGTIYDIDSANSDVYESSSTFLLDVNDDETITLRFDIPQDASDGTHTLEIRLDYGDDEITELEDISIQRPSKMLKVNSYSVSPITIKCDDKVYAFMRITNFGRYDEDARITAAIRGTSISAESDLFELDLDDTEQRNLVLDISDLAPGTYTVIQKAALSDGSALQTRETDLTILNCSSGTGIEVKPIPSTNVSDNNSSSNDQNNPVSSLSKYSFDNTTKLLLVGIGIVVLLIVVSLFLI
ncbi:MAG: hypothetical protein H6500_00935 [Candidatus Woesearchaeota archaeon]|nr:hypothetical protein [Nanoarchaeota archaeon]USN44397.1 MAG: hypothetical protein H6500_00935 [Candidatus Woesearchaeota archaeon]